MNTYPIKEWLEMEKKCEGKTIESLSCNEIGVIIRFTDGTTFSLICGVAQFEDGDDE